VFGSNIIYFIIITMVTMDYYQMLAIILLNQLPSSRIKHLIFFPGSVNCGLLRLFPVFVDEQTMKHWRRNVKTFEVWWQSRMCYMDNIIILYTPSRRTSLIIACIVCSGVRSFGAREMLTPRSGCRYCPTNIVCLFCRQRRNEEY